MAPKVRDNTDLIRRAEKASGEGPCDELIVSDVVVWQFAIANRACNIRQWLTTVARDTVLNMRRGERIVCDCVARPFAIAKRGGTGQWLTSVARETVLNVRHDRADYRAQGPTETQEAIPTSAPCETLHGTERHASHGATQRADASHAVPRARGRGEGASRSARAGSPHRWRSHPFDDRARPSADL